MKNIVFTGGGTAGHIMPNLAIIECLKDYNIYYFGSNGMEKELLKKYNNIHFIEIPSAKFIRSITLKNLKLPFTLLHSIHYCKQKLKEIKPSIIFSKGGYVSVPVAIAGKELHIPILTHESDITIGLANKIIAKVSKHILCSFRITAKKYGRNAIFTGSPIRPQIYRGDASIIKNELKINEKFPTVLVIGGSLGAVPINDAIHKNLDKLTQKYNIIHITGKNNIDKTLTHHTNYHQIEFCSNIEDYFAISDIVISRAGSNTINELLAINKPMLLIPLPKGNSRGDQVLNAEYFYNSGYCNLLYQEDITPETISKKIAETLKNSKKYISNMKKNNDTNANKTIISMIEKYSL